MISVKEAAGILGVSPARVRVLLNNGQLEGQRIGRAWAVSEQSVRQRKQTVRNGRPPAAAPVQGYVPHQPSVEDAHRLYDECREVLAGCYMADFLNDARTHDEALFWVRVADLFLQEEQRKLIAEGVY